MKTVSSTFRESFMNKWGLIIKAAGITAVLIFFVKLDPFYEGLVLFTVLWILLVALLLLIKDTDNPFEVGLGTNGDIDIFHLWDLEKDLALRQKKD